MFLNNATQNEYYTISTPKVNVLKQIAAKLNNKKAGLNNENVSVAFDTNYPNAKVKSINYKGVDNKGSICPIIVKGTSEQIAFAWNVGVGNSTGIGFGSLV